MCISVGADQVLAKTVENQFYCTLKKEYSCSFYYVYRVSKDMKYRNYILKSSQNDAIFKSLIKRDLSICLFDLDVGTFCLWSISHSYGMSESEIYFCVCSHWIQWFQQKAEGRFKKKKKAFLWEGKDDFITILVTLCIIFLTVFSSVFQRQQFPIPQELDKLRNGTN